MTFEEITTEFATDIQDLTSYVRKLHNSPDLWVKDFSVEADKCLRKMFINILDFQDMAAKVKIVETLDPAMIVKMRAKFDAE